MPRKPGATQIPSGRISDSELAAWGALLQTGRAQKVYLVANVAFSPAIRSRVDAVNERLGRLGAQASAKVDLVVVPEP